MCEVDWAAWGTWAAVVVALGFGVWDHSNRRWRERAESRVIAHLLRPDLLTCQVRAQELVTELGLDGEDGDDGGLVLVLRERDPGLRKELAEIAESFPTGALEASVTRLHVLPKAAAAALMEMLAAIREVELAGSSLGDMTNKQAERDLEPFLDSFHAEAKNLLDKCLSARQACDAVIGN